MTGGRALALACALGLAAASRGQTPDVTIKLDLVGAYRTDRFSHSTTRLYDVFGHESTVGLQLRTDLGLRAYVAQKLEVIPHGGDPDDLDEYYIEAPGEWRVGKQYLPFGLERLIREPAVAVRSDLTLPALEIPLAVAGCDAGTGRQRGVVVRAGARFGVSVAVGDHFGIDATSMDLIRLPTQAPGIGRGFHRLFGADYASTTGPWRFAVEYVALRDPQTALDATDTVYDASVHYVASRLREYELGWTHSSQQRADFVRFTAILRATKQVSIEPELRLRNALVFDAGVAIRVRF